MLIRKPVTEVFEALVNPEITSKFWFSSGSGRLEPGKNVIWRWEQFDVQAEIRVTVTEPDRLIRFEWPADETGDHFHQVEIIFEKKTDSAAYVSVRESGFRESDPDLVTQIAEQTGGWALVLSGLKAYLEYDVMLNLVGDHYPAEIM